MRKNDSKSKEQTSIDAQAAKRQMEDKIFSKMMFWLLGALVVEIILLIFNRFYIHTRAGEMGNYMTWHTLLAVLLPVGVILFLVCLFWGSKVRKADGPKEGVGQFILGASCLAVGIGGFVMRLFGAQAAPMVLAVVPGLAVLTIIYYLYQKEFFCSALVGGVGILGLWVFRASVSRAGYYAYLVVAVIILAVVTALVLALKKKDGTLTIKGKSVALLQPNAVYPTYYITAAATLVLLLAPLALGTALAYYAIWGLVAWLFILAVFFTSKLM